MRQNRSSILLPANVILQHELLGSLPESFKRTTARPGVRLQHVDFMSFSNGREQGTPASSTPQSDVVTGRMPGSAVGGGSAELSDTASPAREIDCLSLRRGGSVTWRNHHRKDHSMIPPRI